MDRVTLLGEESYQKVVCQFDAKIFLDLVNSADIAFHPIAAWFINIKLPKDKD